MITMKNGTGTSLEVGVLKVVHHERAMSTQFFRVLFSHTPLTINDILFFNRAISRELISYGARYFGICHLSKSIRASDAKTLSRFYRRE